jgi:hypothetical protein
MSMSHKAFVFDYESFQSELRDLLERSLESGAVEPLKDFIETHRSRLKDPYEGEPLAPDWESLVEYKDVHQYGDFAITRYYEPDKDIGLGLSWQEAEETLKENALGEDVVLGTPIGPEGRLFDPGKMGSYFQSPVTTRDHLRSVKELVRQRPDLDQRLGPVLAMLERAVTAGKGLYTTF